MSAPDEDLCPPEARANGGCKKGTDVPLLPVPSSNSFKAKVVILQNMIAENNMEKIAQVLNFAATIFSMRHPNEFCELLENLEAVQRAKAGYI